MASENTGRVFCGTELDPLYVDVILRRWSSLTGIAPVLVSSGETYAEVEARRAAEQASKIVGPTEARDSTTPQPDALAQKGSAS